MSEEEKVEDVQEEPEDEVHEEEMNSEEVYESISQARVKNSRIFTMISTKDSRFCRIIFSSDFLMKGVPGNQVLVTLHHESLSRQIALRSEFLW